MKKVILVLVLVTMLFSPVFGAGQKATEADDYKVGFAVFMMGQEWYSSIVKGAQVRAQELGIELIVADSNNDSATQVNIIENFIAQQVDAIIISPVDVKALAPIMREAEREGILVVSESNFLEGAVTRVGQSDYDSGYMTGVWFGEYAKENGIEPKLLILGYQSLQNCRDRVDGFKAGINDSGIDYEVKVEVDGGFREASLNAATDAFTAHPEINAVFGINDDSTLGAVSALRGANVNADTFTAILYGLEGVAGRSALESGAPYRAGLSMFPEFVGVACVDAVNAALRGEIVPENYKTPTAVVAASEFSKYFQKDGDTYVLNYEKVRDLL